jgi:alpha-tubulin suppressor-like RCC1 family protein
MVRQHFGHASLALVLACASCKFPALPEIADGSVDGSDSDAFTLPIDAPPPTCNVTPCVVQVSAGGAHTCVRIDDGTVRCWGLNSFGQGGGGTAYPPMDGGIDEYVLPRTYPTPNAVSGLPSANRAVVVGAGGAYRSDGVSCAAMNDLQMWCWGIDKSQQLGRGGATRVGDITNPVPARPVPAPVASISDVKDISVGVRNACAVFQSGSVACWGTAPFRI